MIIYLIPDLFVNILPTCVLIAGIFGYYRLIADHEITALQSLGFSNLKIASPILLIGIMATILTLFINFYTIPKAFSKFRDHEYQLRNQFSTDLLKPGTFATVRGIAIYIRQQQKDGILQGIFIHNPGKDNNKSYTIIADSGKLNNVNGKLTLYLTKGYRYDLDPSKSVQTSFIAFDNLIYDFSHLTKVVAKRGIKPYERPIYELISAAKLFNDPNLVKKMQAEGYQRLVIPFLCITNSIISVIFLLAKLNYRSKKRYLILTSILIGLLVHGVTITFINLGGYFLFLAYVILLTISLIGLIILSKSKTFS